MNGYTTVKIDNDTLLEMLRERVESWTDDTSTIELFVKMYDSYIWGGCFEGADIMEIVDNDYINWCSVIEQGDEEFDELLKIYNEQGLGDCSCETNYASYIEAVDDEDEPTAFLIRD